MRLPRGSIDPVPVRAWGPSARRRTSSPSGNQRQSVTGRLCGWDGNPIPPGARRDAKWCSKRCRQAAHRAKVTPAVAASRLEPRRLAYADPPYVGLAKRYYGDQPTYAGEVDHDELLDRLATYDGWALSCSSSSVPSLMAMADRKGMNVRLAIWARRPKPHPTAALVTAWEGLLYWPARPLERGPDGPLSDVLIGVEARLRPTLPGGKITGTKPPRFCVWLFGLLGAAPGDELDDLFPGSGIVGRTWASWSGDRLGGQLALHLPG